METEVDAMVGMQASPLFFIEDMWGLRPQPLKEQYKTRYAVGLLLRGKDWDKFCESARPDWFDGYEDGKHVTWQQALVLHGIEKGLRGEVPMRISIVSGHGIGKSALIAMIILWFLFVFPESQVPCTAPTAASLYDVLWRELAKWIDRMPREYAALYRWEANHIRMAEAPQTWFARAKTSSKENTEALAGVHADWVLVPVDEASGVEEPIFETMEGALTSGNVLVILISNGTRSIGYFYDTHHKDKERWQNYSFNSEESPRVDQKYVDAIIAKYGSDSVQYAIRVQGRFPADGLMDDAGYVQLFNEKDLHLVPFDREWKPVGRVHGALDASGEGQDTSEWGVRDRMRAAIVATEQTSTASSMAIRSLTVCDKFGIDPIDFTVDAFGSGHAVSQEIALATAKQQRPWRVTPINVGDQCDDEDDKEQFINIRAMLYYRFLLWCRAGGEIMDAPRLKEELLSIRFKRTPAGKIQIMDKIAMKKLGFNSPNMADALSMCFLRRDTTFAKRSVLGEELSTQETFDPHAPLG